MVLQNLAWAKHPPQVQARLINFNVREQMVSDSALQLIFNKLPPVKFWYSIKEYRHYIKKTIRKMLPGLLGGSVG